jgi:hypothetical protein
MGGRCGAAGVVAERRSEARGPRPRQDQAGRTIAAGPGPVMRVMRTLPMRTRAVWRSGPLRRRARKGFRWCRGRRRFQSAGDRVGHARAVLVGLLCAAAEDRDAATSDRTVPRSTDAWRPGDPHARPSRGSGGRTGARGPASASRGSDPSGPARCRRPVTTSAARPSGNVIGTPIDGRTWIVASARTRGRPGRPACRVSKATALSRRISRAPRSGAALPRRLEPVTPRWRDGRAGSSRGSGRATVCGCRPSYRIDPPCACPTSRVLERRPSTPCCSGGATTVTSGPSAR